MKVDDEMLMALADGELDPETAAQLQARIAADPALRAEYELFAQTARALREGPGLGPVPERLIRAIRDTPVATGDPVAAGVAWLATGTPAIGTAAIAPPAVATLAARAWRPLAIAAGLALAFVAGQSFAPSPAGFSPQAYAQLPTGESRSLPGRGTGTATGGDAGSDPGTATVRALASYDTAEGLCRHLRHQDKDLTEEILLCQSGTAWTVRLALRSEGAPGAFIPASNPAAALIDAALDQMAAGDPLSPEEEQSRLKPPGS